MSDIKVLGNGTGQNGPADEKAKTMTTTAEPDLKPDARNSGRTGSLKITPRRSLELTPSARRRIAALTTWIKAEEPKIDDTAVFGADVRMGCGDGPGIWFGDTAEIPLMSLTPDKRFDYRMGWLAGKGDVVVVGGPDCLAFETYQKRLIGADCLTYLNVDPRNKVPRRATAAICLRDEEAFAQLLSVLAA